MIKVYLPSVPCSRSLPVETNSKVIGIPRGPLRWDIAPFGFPLPLPSQQDLLTPVPLFRMRIPPMPIHMPGGRVALPTARKSGVPCFHQPPGMTCRFQHFCTPMLLNVTRRKAFLHFLHFRAWPPPPPSDPQCPPFQLQGISKTIRLRIVQCLVTSNVIVWRLTLGTVPLPTSSSSQIRRWGMT
jgi:hypothetical protein